MRFPRRPIVSLRHASAFTLAVLVASAAYAQYDVTNGPGQITAQYYDSPTTEGIINVIDNMDSTKFLSFHQTCWIQFHANASYRIGSYELTSANDHPERDPLTWTLEGSNDGAVWSTIDSRTGEVFGGRFLTRRFHVAGASPCSYYRITMTCSSDRIQLAEWSLYTTVTHDVAATLISLNSTTPGTTATPSVTVGNYGLGAESFDVVCRIDSAGRQVYNQTVNVASLTPATSRSVTLPSFAIAGPTYTLRAWTTLATDSVRGNDTATYWLMAGSYNPSHDSIVYVVTGAHLDDQWQWTLTNSIRDALPATMRNNFRLFEAYPEYQFSFEGAYRYKLMKQFYPGAYDTLKSWVQRGRWHYVGTFWDPCDVLVPSAEALVRQALYGTEFSKKEFGKRSVDIYLPDCFGFGYALPTIARHCGITGFSTQKFDGWGGFRPSPFSIGRWVGVDGSEVVASLKPGAYTDGLSIRSNDGNTLKATSGMWLTQDYVGTGDFGGSASDGDISALVTRMRANGSNSIKVICPAGDQLFRDLSPVNVAALPSYDGELLMTAHGTGCYTSWASMKLRNRRNEQRAAAAELACVTANWLTGGAFEYPQDTITAGWERFLACQFHDVLTGTSIPGAYSIAIPMEDSSYADFNYALGLGNTAVASGAGQQLTTTVNAAGRVPVVLFNPLAFERIEAVEAVVTLNGSTHAGVRVFDQNGAEVPAQVSGSSGQTDTIVFVARVPAAGYAVYEAEATPGVNPPVSSLSLRTSATGDTLENAFYRVVVNANGDIASVYHKPSARELLATASRLEFRPNVGGSWPAWEVNYSDVSATPTGYVDQGVVKSVKENGPARVSLKVERTRNGSTFTQFIRLAADSAGARVDVANAVNWLTTSALLKVGFPVTCSNPLATFDLGIGAITRPNMTSNLYEVPGQQWADMTATAGDYGLSILNDCKYGWNKESDSKLNLTLIHSPTATSYDYQQDLSSLPLVGIHRFTYSFYGHSGSWTNGTVQQAASLNQPVLAYQVQPRTGTRTFREISVVSAESPQVMVMAVKKAQSSNYYVVRVREAHGMAASDARLRFGAAITSAVELNGTEEAVVGGSAFSSSGQTLAFSLSRFQPRTFGVTLSGSPQVSTYPRGSWYRGGPSTDIAVRMALPGHTSTATFRLGLGETVKSIRVLNASGRLVKSLSEGQSPDCRLVAWDGRTDDGAGVGAGLYFVCVRTSLSVQTAPMVVPR